MTSFTEGSIQQGDILFHALAACSPVGTFLIDVAGSCTYTNPRCRAICGFTDEEARGMGWVDFISVEDREAALREWNAQIFAGREYSGQLRFRHRNGHVRLVNMRSAPLVTPDGTLLGQVATVEDVTEETAIREMIEAREALFRAQYQAIPMPTYTWQVMGADWVLIDFNLAAEEFTHGHIRNALGTTARRLLGHEPEIIDDFERCTRERSTFQRAMEHRMGTTGEVREIVSHYAFVAPDLVMIHTQDVTRQRALERYREDFLSAAAHDLKTPLTTIKGFVQLIERRLDRVGELGRDEARPHLERIERTVDQMTTLVGELLDVTRLQMGQDLELVLRDVDLVALARRVVGEQRQTELHRIVVEAEEETLVGIWDSSRLQRVVENLLTNAVTYSPDGGDIRLHVRREGKEAVLSIMDQGIGIPAHDLPHIFERFYRGSNTAGQIAGTGIGLAGSRHIIEQHGGTITVDSTEGKGSTFTVRLPIAVVWSGSTLS